MSWSKELILEKLIQNIKDCIGEYPIHCIVYKRQESEEIIRNLITGKADPLCVNAEQQSALHLTGEAGDHKSVQIWFSLGADVTLTDSEGINALHYAAYSKDFKTMVAVLDNNRTEEVKLATSKDKNGKSALHHLLSSFLSPEQVESVQLLLDQGVNGSKLDEAGVSPLATYFLGPNPEHNVEICRLLLAIEGNVSFVKEDGHTLGHQYAGVWDPEAEVLEILNEHGVDMVRRDLQERTVLHHLAISGSLTRSTLTFLLDVIGLDPCSKDKSGKTALQYATERELQKPIIQTFMPPVIGKGSRTYC